MTSSPDYTPPAVWTWNKANGGQFANINRPIAGPTHDKELPVGKHPLQLYSLGTPNGVKVTVMLEELLALGNSGAEYDAWLIKINEGDQFGSYANSRRIQDWCREHVAIIEAIAGRDFHEASARMRLHLEQALTAAPGAQNDGG